MTVRVSPDSLSSRTNSESKLLAGIGTNLLELAARLMIPPWHSLDRQLPQTATPNETIRAWAINSSNLKIKSDQSLERSSAGNVSVAC